MNGDDPDGATTEHAPSDDERRPDEDLSPTDDDRPPADGSEPAGRDAREGTGDARTAVDAAGEGTSGVVGEDGRAAGRRATARQLHPLSVPYRAVTRTLRPSTLIVLATAVGAGSLDPGSSLFVWFLGATLLATVAYQYAYYRRFEFALTADTFDVASGVFSRRSREIPLRRVQNVDVGQNPLQRALGIAALRIETAGGGDTEAVLEYLGREEAERLRDDLRRAARRVRESGSGDAPGVAADATTESDREEVFALSRRSLVVLSLFSFDAGAGVISSFVGAVLSGGDPSNLVGVGRALEDLPLGPVETALIGVVAVGVLAWLLSVGLTFARYYGFRLVRVDEGLEYERGLLQRFSGTIPVEKVQTVAVRSNLVHRRLGYATVAVETAGYSPGSDRSANQLAVPLAPRAEALQVARSVEPFDAEALALERPPRRARRRYVVRFALGIGLLTALGAGALWGLARAGVGPGLGADRRVLAVPLVALGLAPLAAHLRWRSRGFRAGADHFVTRTGFWRRVARVVPYYRVQTVIDSRSVFQRRRDLASVTADTASSASLLGGDAVALDVDADTADDLRERLRSELDRAIRERAARSATPADAAAEADPSQDDRDVPE